jgi:peroxiredoxin
MNRHFIVLALFAVALAWGLILQGRDAAWAKDPLFRTMGILHDGRPSQAPEFSLTTPNGTIISLAQLRGKVVFLNFWATWCSPCRVEMPSMERLHKEFKDEGLAMVAIDVDESPEQVARFMTEFRLSFPALLDEEVEVATRYSVRGLPATFLIDRGGRTVGTALGARDWASPEGRALVRALLEGRAQGK